MDDIPPPLIPAPPGGPDAMYLPFLLADAPRLQLEFLSRNKSLSVQQRSQIAKWLKNYNFRLVEWLHDTYGPEGVKAADAMSRSVAGKMAKMQAAAMEQAEVDLFGRLQREMGEDDE